jgi:hypothetical protein
MPFFDVSRKQSTFRGVYEHGSIAVGGEKRGFEEVNAGIRVTERYIDSG